MARRVPRINASDVYQDDSGNLWARQYDEDGNALDPIRVKQGGEGYDDDGNATGPTFSKMSQADIVRADQGARFAGIPSDDDFTWADGDTIPYDVWLRNVWQPSTMAYPGNANDVQAQLGFIPTADQALQYGFTQFRPNADGTVTFDSSLRGDGLYYNGSTSFMERFVPAALLGLWGGAIGGALTGAGGLSGASAGDLAALIESGTVGEAGAALEAAAGIGSTAGAVPGFVNQALGQAGKYVATNALKGGIDALMGQTAGAAGGASLGLATTAPTKRGPVAGAFDPVSLNLNPSSARLQRKSGGDVYDAEGNIRGGLITPYLRG